MSEPTRETGGCPMAGRAEPGAAGAGVSADGAQDSGGQRAGGLGGRLARLPRQLARRSPFEGDITPTRVGLVGFGRPALPFPHPWNYREPLRILETFFYGAESVEGSGRHSRYLDVPGFAPVLVTRDPALIRAISVDTGSKPGQFDRDTLPTGGIARATGHDTLLYANGEAWKRQKKLSTPPFSRGSLYQPDQFGEFEATFRRTAEERLGAFRRRVAGAGEPLRVPLEPEIKAVMLEMLVNNFFGGEVEDSAIRGRFVPGVDAVISHIVRDTVVNKLGVPLSRVPGWLPGVRAARAAQAAFEELTDAALAGRARGSGLWAQFESDAPDEALRSNIRVFLAGALEATTSFASWALSHLARDEAWQERVYEEVRGIETYTPEALRGAVQLGRVLDETLRLTPALYFHPRRATVDRWVETLGGARLRVPRGTHVLLDVWHANRCEDHWGVARTGHPAGAFCPERWEAIGADSARSKEMLHFGFGHGPRFCPGKHLGQLEVALVVGAVVRMFRLRAVRGENPARAGVSTKPADGVEVELRSRV